MLLAESQHPYLPPHLPFPTTNCTPLSKLNNSPALCKHYVENIKINKGPGSSSEKSACPAHTQIPRTAKINKQPRYSKAATDKDFRNSKG